MKKIIAIVLFISFYQSGFAFYNITRIESNVRDIIDEFDPNINIGVVVHSKKASRNIVNINANRAYVPASSLKLLTGISSLLYLSPNHRFETSIFFNPQKIKKNALNDDLYIKFTGDPELTKNELSHMISKLKKRGILSINGRLYIDDKQFAGKPFGPGWMWDDQQSCYSAPLSAVIINRNCAAFTIETYKNRKKAVISNNFGLPIQNNLLRSRDRHCGHQINVSRKNEYAFSGCVYPGKHVIELAINHPEHYAESYVRKLLRQHGIRIQRGVSSKKVPKNLKAQLTHRSPKLSTLVKTMLKESDNLIADSLLKTIGATYYKRSGNWRNGVKAIRKIIRNKLGVNLNKTTIVDGAGLSRYNLIRPKQLVELLAKMQRYPALLSALKNSLPIAGKDGTLKYRFRKYDAKVLAKTGTMNGVTSLAGYLNTKKRDTFSFAIIVNGIVGKPTRYKRLEEKLCQYFSKL